MPSPDWLKHRLAAAGIRAINNVVDCTNYVVWELGQPLHAFDRALITEGHVIVRMAHPGESIVTIDGQERFLGGDDLLIADPKGGIALAGIMGGLNTEVNDATICVLLESAHFDATTIRRTSLRVGLSTEASYRFERFVDPNLTLPALARAAELMLETAWGEIAGPAIDVKVRDFTPRNVELRPSRCNALLGTDISPDHMAVYLSRLGMTVEHEPAPRGEPKLRVTVPTFRPDIEREVDLIEEIAIVHGYENIPATIAGNLTATGRLTRRQKLERRVAEVMRQCGLNETLSFSMMNPADLDRLALPANAPERNAVKLSNPMAADASLLRTTLLPALLAACVGNQNQGVDDVALFEINPVYLHGGEDELPREPKHLAGVLTGNLFTAQWNLSHVTLDFFWVKGILQELARALGLEFSWRPSQHPSFSPGQAADVLLGEEVIGVAGRIAPAVLEAYDLRRDVFAFEIDLEPVLAVASLHPTYTPVARFPAARRDVAVVAPDDDAHSAAVLETAIRQAGGQFLEDVTVFDVFTDPERFGPGRRSIAFHLTWRAPDRTMTDEEVDTLMAKVVDALRSAGADMRT
jgi:phenylalanyl-tRNA synthetase beta chain